MTTSKSMLVVSDVGLVRSLCSTVIESGNTRGYVYLATGFERRRMKNQRQREKVRWIRERAYEFVVCLDTFQNQADAAGSQQVVPFIFLLRTCCPCAKVSKVVDS